MPARHCPALLIAAPASGQGKTTVTAALARLHVRQGKRVRVFKCGPDFLDPMILARASGAPVYQLDLWMVGEAESRRLLWEAAAEADLILIEGVMGLFDGTPSAADLARRFNVPVLAVIDGSAMAQTFGAVAHGLATFQADLPFSGVLGNRVGSARHGEILRDALPSGIRWYGALPRSAEVGLPSRHLGLVQAGELVDLDARLDAAADALAASADTTLPPRVSFAAPEQPVPVPLLKGVRIGVARDSAFAFLYQANLDLLRALGAELVFFSPLTDAQLPPVDSLYLPGGYPELHLPQLEANQAMAHAIRAHHAAGKPIHAECGGMLYLLDRLTDKQGVSGRMLGLLSGEATLQPRMTAMALQKAELPEGQLRGHSFHYSALTSDLQPLTRGECPNYKRTAEAVYRQGRLTASYIHFYFPSAPEAAAALFHPEGSG
ncbi:cobyrinic acid a,c-diamide synthase [Pseudomonas cuatrocienegasensis]|uniref:Hydrogenobyrinate a,c-diamide synthase n=1 Tax=Pseudomonas cuatrocienegasensis TaxID=543360 RepID=A0ABY1BAA0_9PSED|nr:MULTISPECIES: cobyrinate a,c-diamide synthase [Pseudomonas]OEC34982.1 cobyrinic acid a,c-diamide synthase [Pseudomonas sp. 21C1]SEQ37075.1 cobyrinic acid a,c-diamide synthase [Pseudomonas cuatrocienegasensis]